MFVELMWFKVVVVFMSGKYILSISVCVLLIRVFLRGPGVFYEAS